jgi:AraC-like DNA-binding protein
MSKPTFSRQFKKHCGKTLSDFVQQVRLDAACHELAETDHPIIDVALGNGFSQISFFNRVFRRAIQCSPSEYRARTRKQMRR